MTHSVTCIVEGEMDAAVETDRDQVRQIKEQQILYISLSPFFREKRAQHRGKNIGIFENYDTACIQHLHTSIQEAYVSNPTILSSSVSLQSKDILYSNIIILYFTP